MPWRCDTGGGEPSEVYPIDDLREHETGTWRCWCRPEWVDGFLVHNALDGREAFERGERRLS